jgi:chaperonin GroES
MKVVPMGERVLIRAFKEGETRTEGGIYIPESAQEKKKEGIVVAVGRTKDGKDLPLKEGDRVLYGGYSFEKLEIDGQEHIILNFKDILAKIE